MMISAVVLDHNDDSDAALDDDQCSLCNELAPFLFVLIFTILPRNVTPMQQQRCCTRMGRAATTLNPVHDSNIFFNIYHH